VKPTRFISEGLSVKPEPAIQRDMGIDIAICTPQSLWLNDARVCNEECEILMHPRSLDRKEFK
jgi:hypothetical protein